MFRKISIFFITALLIISWSGFVEAKKCKLHDRVRVKKDGDWYTATIENVKGNKCLVNYEKYTELSDEWIHSKYIKTIKSKYIIGDTVYVNWKGDWWPAEILKIRKGRYKVHFKGHPMLWDEWVTTDRMVRFSDEIKFTEVKED